MADVPTHIRALTDRGELELHWPTGSVHRLPFRLLREDCPCAACVDEVTGRRVLDVAAIPQDIRPTALNFAGNYALKIAWSDGHDTGLYTWDHLARLCGHDV